MDSGNFQHPTDTSSAISDSENTHAPARKQIEDLRRRLLDLTIGNRLLNFRFSERSRTHIRIIHELPDVIFDHLQDGTPLTFSPLRRPDDIPQDEKTGSFIRAFEEAKRTDEAYLLAIDDQSNERLHQKLERELRDRVRKSLGLPPVPPKPILTPSDIAKKSGFNPSYDLPDPQDGTLTILGFNDKRIQTRLFPEEMQRKLTGIRDGARVSLSELGINTLHVSFGCLEWYESKDSERVLYAPLIFLPVVISQSLEGARYRFQISAGEEDAEVNITLRERLKRDFRIELPSFGETDTPESYFSKITQMIPPELRNWRVRRFVTVGLFSFGRLAMYNDLDSTNWPKKSELHNHPILVSLLEGSPSDGPLLAEEYDQDDPLVESKVPYLITDADSSQFSAIVDVIDGRNIAIQGPPGTGKSQTITNIIAAALAKGRKVLFVAEKMAALEVVKKRLDDAGLGDFCLEVHSTKARKVEILSSLEKRLALQQKPSQGGVKGLRDEYSRLRSRLARYVELLSKPVGATSKTLHDILWLSIARTSQVKAEGLPIELEEVVLDNASLLSDVDLGRISSVLGQLEEASRPVIENYGAVSRHPCLGIHASSLDPFEQKDLIHRFRVLHSCLSEMQLVSHEFGSLIGMTGPYTIAELSTLSGLIHILPNDPAEAMLGVLPKITRGSDLLGLDQFLVYCLLEHQRIRKELRPHFEALDGTTPNLAVLETIQNDIDQMPDHWDLQSTEIRALPDLADEFLRRAQDVQSQCQVLSRLLQIGQIDLPKTRPAIQAFLRAVCLLHDTPIEVLSRRRIAILTEGAKPFLRTAKETARFWLDLRRDLSMALDPDITLSPSELRRLSTSLRRSGVLGRWIRPSCRRARRLWRSLRSNQRRISSLDIAQYFDQLSDLVDASNSFTHNESLAEICGDDFRGLDTDFALLIRVSEYGEKTRQILLSSFEAKEAVCRLLFETATNSILELLAFTDSDTVSTINTALDIQRNPPMGGTDEADMEDFCRDCLGASKRLRSLHRSLKEFGLHDSVLIGEIPGLVTRIERLSELEEVATRGEGVKDLLGNEFLGVQTNPQTLRRTIQIARALESTTHSRDTLSRLCADGYADRLESQTRFTTTIDRCLAEISQIESSMKEQRSVDVAMFFSADNSNHIPLNLLNERIDYFLSHESELFAWREYDSLETAATNEGMNPLVDAFTRAGVPPRGLPLAFESVFYRSLLRKVYSDYPDLREFTGLTLDRVRYQFRRIDSAIIRASRDALACTLAHAHIPRGVGTGPKREWTELPLVQNEISKKTRHIPLRDLFRRASGAIKAIKPCWMMSPASIAQFLRQEPDMFDILVIDEASQMEPEDSLGGIGRSNQVVVVGDPQQLPPTNFFQRIDLGTEETDEDAEDTVDSESILDIALSRFRPARRLRWHYRSHHESLIAFSNKEFYDGDLVVFPSPRSKHTDLGVKHVKIPGHYVPKARVNMPELQAVAKAAIDHMQTFKDRSLGIVTANQTQRDALSDEMDRLFASTTSAEAYRRKWDETLEPFFVKNIENVQGDERDVVFISTVYGPNETGRVLQHFGPINSETGHRRLNVLFTRAKEKVVVFSSLEPTDILLSDSSRRGVRVLRDYLRYAQTGDLETGKESGKEFDSEFERFVADRLKEEGFTVIPQIGVQGFFIDLAIVNPHSPGDFLLGIECDGSAYHSTKAARDRDRLRQDVLERLGWRIYRIWSTDWFGDTEGEVSKLKNHIARLLKESHPPEPPQGLSGAPLANNS